VYFAWERKEGSRDTILWLARMEFDNAKYVVNELFGTC